MNLQQPIDQSKIWYLPQLDNLRFMQAHYIEHAFKPHSHDYFVLGIIESGLQSFTYEHEHLVTAPGSIIIINPNEIHTGEAAIPSGFSYRAFYPTSDLMELIADEFHIKPLKVPVFKGGIAEDQDLYRRIQQFHRLSEDQASLMDIEDQITHFFVDLIQRHANHSFTMKHYHHANQAIIQVQDYLEAHYADNISLSDLSTLVHISPYHLARLFRQQVGVPPHKYLENVRIRHAENLLNSGMSISDVAFMTGFSSQSHLTRTFKHFMGSTPGQFIQDSKIV